MFKVSQSDSSIFNLPQSYQTNQSQPVAQKSKFIVTQEPLLSMPKKKGKFLNLKRISSRIESDSSINGRWTREEHRRFIDAIITYGNDWKKIQNYVYSRSSTQARSHAQKFLLKLIHIHDKMCGRHKFCSLSLPFSFSLCSPRILISFSGRDHRCRAQRSGLFRHYLSF